ncbi:MAG: hypothetical protein A2147_07835 [Chloroflexi bacterium RBG_16_57_8]|nr:MAG: hypothetical protein A2147_07835 [Chloroflexi bacterium RBG_16_57_8]
MPDALQPDPTVKASRPVHFDWKDVDDDSGVTYTLQVATNDKFEDILVEKEGLTASEYTLAKDEDLESVIKQTPYFWRVKAADSAANESDWSEAGSFYLGTVLTLPNGETDLRMSALVVYIAGALLAGAIAGAFFLGRRFSRRKIIITNGPFPALRQPEHKELDVYS